MSNPLISVVMPVYNGEKYLREAIDSILNQTFINFEFLILNDGSTDKTEEIILSYDDPRIRYIKNKTNLQIVKTLNKGIELAKGKYIARMDADDISLPERFKKQVTFMEDNPEIDVCGSYIKIIGTDKIHYWKYPTTDKSIKISALFSSPIAHPSVIIKKDFFNFKKYDIFYQKAEDYYLWTNNLQTSEFSNIPEALLCYRVHENQIGKRYQTIQLKLSNQIRFNLLGEFGIKPTKKEFEVHEKISRYQYVDIFKAEAWLYKLYQQNKINYKFDNNALEKIIAEKWWWCVNNSAFKGLRIFFYYHKSKKINFSSQTLLENIKFFIRCLIKYTYK